MLNWISEARAGGYYGKFDFYLLTLLIFFMINYVGYYFCFILRNVFFTSHFQRMVTMMGARFSKPLIANQITHLICYKFEGTLHS